MSKSDTYIQQRDEWVASIEKTIYEAFPDFSITSEDPVLNRAYPCESTVDSHLAVHFRSSHVDLALSIWFDFATPDSISTTYTRKPMNDFTTHVCKPFFKPLLDKYGSISPEMLARRLANVRKCMRYVLDTPPAELAKRYITETLTEVSSRKDGKWYCLMNMDERAEIYKAICCDPISFLSYDGTSLVNDEDVVFSPNLDFDYAVRFLAAELLK